MVLAPLHEFLIVRKALFVMLLVFLTLAVSSAVPPRKSKFYDFSDQLIDGEIRKPTALYTDARQKAKFDRLLRLKKSFLPKLYGTSKMKVFK